MNAIALILQLLDLAVAGAMTYDRVQQLRARLAQLQAEGREPTEAEWAELLAETESLSGRLDAADKRLNP